MTNDPCDDWSETPLVKGKEKPKGVLVLISDCWPFSGKKYKVYYRGKQVFETNDLSEAEDWRGIE